MRRSVMLLPISLIVLLSIASLAQALEPSVPYHICGTVTDDGKNVTGAVITIERIETGETNLKNSDRTDKSFTSTPPRFDITTNEEGHYFIQLSYLEAFEDNDVFKITATKNDNSGSIRITIDTDNPPGIEDANIEIEKSFDFSLLLIIILLIIIIAVIFGLIKR